MLIANAEVEGRSGLDVRIEAGRITNVADGLPGLPNEPRLEAEGGALLPGLHDHHLHLFALAAAQQSLRCGPPEVRSEAELGRLLRAAEPSEPGGWLRGIGYHESVAGALDRHSLDRLAPSSPLRIQHRSGALWMLNSAAVKALALDDGVDAKGIERDASGRATGRLFRLDRWLGERLAVQSSRTPSLAPVSRLLAERGVTGVTDATPSNAARELALFTAASSCGELRQRLLVMGTHELPVVGTQLPAVGTQLAVVGTQPSATGRERVQPGPLKILLFEGELPAFEHMCDSVRRAHDRGRAVAVHCVTRTELVFTAEVLAAAGPGPLPDRIEHAAIAPPELALRLAELGVAVVTQPNFVRERGDVYLRDVESADRSWLYRCGGLVEAGIPTGAGTDAPFGDPDPWRAMQAAVDRKTESGAVLRCEESVSPERALALFTTPLEAPGGAPRRIAPGAPADLCLLDRSWTRARDSLSRLHVAATFLAGELVYSRIEGQPTQRLL